MLAANALEIATVSAHKSKTKGNERCSWLYFSRPYGGNISEFDNVLKSGHL